MAYVTVSVDVDLSDIGTTDMEDELVRRSRSPSDAVDHADAHQKMFMALAVGKNDEALSLLRDYLCDCLGRRL